MARYFKKRRKNQGPNKNEEKVQRAADARSRETSGGALGTRYPSVQRIKITLCFLTAQQQLLEEKVMDLKSSDACRFDIPCPGRCGTGRFDFSAAFANAVARRQTTAESGAPCREPVFAGSSETCGCQVSCRMEIDYAPERAPSAQPGPAASM